MQIAFAALSEVGPKRDRNEDSVGAFAPADPEAAATKGYAFVVADGMGGASAGEVASRMAVDAVLRPHVEDAFADPRTGLSRAVGRANSAIFGKAAADAELKGMGTTCTVLVLRDHKAFIGHVGDSRAYVLRCGQLIRLTQDHSLRDRGPAFAHILTRAVGIGQRLEVDILDPPLDVEDGDVFLLCSDGLWAEVPETVLISTMTAERNLARLCRRLIDDAYQAGTTDNVTAQLIRVSDPSRRRRWWAPLWPFRRSRLRAQVSWSTHAVGDAAGVSA